MPLPYLLAAIGIMLMLLWRTLYEPHVDKLSKWGRGGEMPKPPWT